MNGNRGFPSMTALLGLLAVAGFQNRDKLAELLRGGGQAPNPVQPGASPMGSPQAGGLGSGGGNVLGGLAGALGAGSLGSILSGGIGEIVERFRSVGQGPAVDSWISTGPNQDVAPDQMRRSIGADTLRTLAAQTNLSEDEILRRLSSDLPKLVDQYTPQGQIPTAEDIDGMGQPSMRHPS